jgi:hypothetical protein
VTTVCPRRQDRTRSRPLSCELLRWPVSREDRRQTQPAPAANTPLGHKHSSRSMRGAVYDPRLTPEARGRTTLNSCKVRYRRSNSPHNGTRGSAAMGSGSEVKARAAAVTTQIMAPRVRLVLYNSWMPYLFGNSHCISNRVRWRKVWRSVRPWVNQKLGGIFITTIPGLLVNPLLYCTMPSCAQTTLPIWVNPDEALQRFHCARVQESWDAHRRVSWWSDDLYTHTNADEYTTLVTSHSPVERVDQYTVKRLDPHGHSPDTAERQ